MDELDKLLDELTDRVYVVVKKNIETGTVTPFTNKITLQEASEYWRITYTTLGYTIYVARHSNLYKPILPLPV